MMSIYPRYWRSNECITTRNLLVFSRWVVLRDSIYYIGEGNGSPLQHFCLENPMDGGTWWATVHGSQSQTWLSNFTSLNLLYYIVFSCLGHSNEISLCLNLGNNYSLKHLFYCLIRLMKSTTLCPSSEG